MDLNYQTSGEGSPVILLHGLFGSLENLNGIRRALETCHTVISVDLPDHGDSPHSSHFSYANYAGKIHELMNTLALDKAAVLGHSMGGKVAMTLALRYPDRVSKLVIADIAPVKYPDRHGSIIEALKSVKLSGLENRTDADKQLARQISEKGIRQFLLKSLQKTDKGWAWKFNLPLLESDYPEITDWADSDKHYDGPVLFIKGERSDYLQAGHKPVIGRLFPNSRGAIIEGAGHWLHAEKPARFNEIVLDFLNQE
ncbi:alpha/beta fold hydrolase [Lacimicrobium alkaliphilum]|uniref:Acyl-CoA esterase n=1 Tax=Lacimicrobium alkaliphilum TaxID=1526571 RepID=A0ABQ1R0P9_9ALTE|nr:alpha/beta fold hydrolase [Lacimicrobium alkaliphilum]GGD53999.1 acyl-CoA esterase [Lacimicrobium alkaliphilum]